MALVGLAWRPDRPRLAGGVLGGGVLVGLAIWAIAGAVNRVAEAAKTGQNRGVFAGLPLVNFFTRHVILALVAYGMMLGLHLDPLGMLLGVSSAVAAALLEARRYR